MKQGKVWLVGAGPGDMGLLTLKGKEVLEQADVVLYDKLVGTAILNMIPDSAQKIDVGKCAGNHTMPQAEINLLLLSEAQKGHHVVRLKGGDPFLFGRGGEELELLKKHHIPFEIVPGVTSAVSVPAYAGIPVTHRNFASSVHIITGHKKADPNWKVRLYFSWESVLLTTFAAVWCKQENHLTHLPQFWNRVPLLIKDVLLQI